MVSCSYEEAASVVERRAVDGVGSVVSRTEAVQFKQLVPIKGDLD